MQLGKEPDPELSARVRCFRRVLLVVWKFAGFYMIILLVGLQSIPDDVMRLRRSMGRAAGRHSASSPSRSCARRSPCH